MVNLKKCPNCGKEVREGTNFCNNCGSKVNKSLNNKSRNNKDSKTISTIKNSNFFKKYKNLFILIFIVFIILEFFILYDHGIISNGEYEINDVSSSKIKYREIKLDGSIDEEIKTNITLNVSKTPRVTEGDMIYINGYLNGNKVDSTYVTIDYSISKGKYNGIIDDSDTVKIEIIDKNGKLLYSSSHNVNSSNITIEERHEKKPDYSDSSMEKETRKDYTPSNHYDSSYDYDYWDDWYYDYYDEHGYDDYYNYEDWYYDYDDWYDYYDDYYY